MKPMKINVSAFPPGPAGPRILKEAFLQDPTGSKDPEGTPNTL